MVYTSAAGIFGRREAVAAYGTSAASIHGAETLTVADAMRFAVTGGMSTTAASERTKTDK